jgi:hypothetical protein
MIHPILRRYWPPEGQILLLKVALADPESAKRAWNAWAAVNNLDNASWAEVRLLATAARRVREFDPASPFLRRLDGVRRFVWTTTQLNVNAAIPLLARLCEADLRLMLIKGAARLALDPQSSADRFLTDIDVLVHPDDWPKALELANQHGWRSPLWPTLTPQIFPHHHAVAIEDNSGCTIDLHHLALFICRNVGDDDGLWQRAKPATLRGIKLFAPSPTDELLTSIVHGQLYAPAGSIADWVLDIAPLIRSAEVDWAVLESETRARNVDASIASGLLLAVEQFKLPVQQAMLDRVISRVREPFITDFRNFATGYRPSDPWTIERVKAAAALRALSAARRVKTHRQMPATPSEGRFRGARVKQIFSRIRRAYSPSATHTAPQIAAGHPILFAAPTNLDSQAILILKVSLHVEPHSGSHRPILQITAPGLNLKRWRAPVGAGLCHIFVQMPAALFTMRRIEHVELCALETSLAVSFKNVSLSWSVLNDPSETYPALLQLFDPIWYQRKQSAIAASYIDLLWDYLVAGWLDGRNPSARFDANRYLRCNYDVASAGINPLLHYVRNGTNEGRVAHPVRVAETAADTCPSANDSFASEYRDVAESGYFDEAFYCSEYPEVLTSDLDPMNEYVRGGWRGKRSPGLRFDSEWYLQNYPDVAATETNPLVHYLQYGRAEGRQSRRFDSQSAGTIGAAVPRW